MRRIIGVFLSLLVIVGLTTACGKKDDVLDNKTIVEEAAENSEKWPRTFLDAKGNKVVIEKKPEKIVSLWYSYPEILVALDEMPIGTTECEFLTSLNYLKDIKGMDSLVELGDKLAPNIEKIVELEPDLILATSNHEAIYSTLTKIAPVIILDREAFYNDWTLGVRTFGEILGKEEEAELVIASIMEKIENGREKLKHIDGETIALIKTWDGKSYYVESSKDPSYIYTFDEKKGLGLTPDEEFVKMGGENISMEGLSKIKADHIFLEADISLNESILKDLEKNSVWNSLEAVKNGNVYFLDISAITGGPLATEYGIESIINALSK